MSVGDSVRVWKEFFEHRIPLERVFFSVLHLCTFNMRKNFRYYLQYMLVASEESMRYGH